MDYSVGMTKNLTYFKDENTHQIILTYNFTFFYHKVNMLT